MAALFETDTIPCMLNLDVEWIEHGTLTVWREWSAYNWMEDRQHTFFAYIKWKLSYYLRNDYYLSLQLIIPLKSRRSFLTVWFAHKILNNFVDSIIEIVNAIYFHVQWCASRTVPIFHINTKLQKITRWATFLNALHTICTAY